MLKDCFKLETYLSKTYLLFMKQPKMEVYMVAKGRDCECWCNEDFD